MGKRIGFWNILLAASLVSLLFIFSKTFSLVREGRSSLVYALELDGTNTSSHNDQQILLVSGLFPLSKSKHSTEDYRSWLTLFLGSVTTDIYFFTTPELAEVVADVRGSLPITINTTFSTPFDIPPLAKLKEPYEQMHAIDRERSRHSAELYAIWNGKPYYLDEAVKNSEKQYSYAFWSDAGSFRNDHVYRDWPSSARVEEVWDEGSRMSGVAKEDLLFFPMWEPPHASMKNWQEALGPVDTDFSEGSFFGGSPQTVRWWKELFYLYHDYYLSQGIFVGKDQTLINALFLLHPSRVITVWVSDPDAPAHQGLVSSIEGPLGSCGDNWYYYQFWLSDVHTRNQMRKLWNSKSWFHWWKERSTCRLTRTLSIKDVLNHRFGANWTPPSAALALPSGSVPS
ncbi:MAG: hypothetical protein NXY57DRAFT_1029640 [Lentinula lateritia]|uniref:Glycosyltransferase family 15 protein n=1 Tax=Lentinula lateritia TaxID=40482 RepID=A0ABQ8VVJ3_9AGAR|nr:MAG: hypothetical protein NXY57DRAFT_1029640 [Lentinula lateritia]KAJ4500383.1 hypothetical protein C8R41DRAFT_811223 [Lentinula lateritia]